MSKTAKTLCWIGSVLLLFMAAFHGSGLLYISDLIQQSNAEDFLKDIVPVLFLHPSLHLASLAGFGILAIFLTQDAGKVLFVLSLIVLVDAGLAFYLGGWLPGSLLTAAALCFGIAGRQPPKAVA